MTPALITAFAVCIVVGIRIWITSRTDKGIPEYPPRLYLDFGLGFIAFASVVRAAGSWIDTMTKQPGLSDLGWRIPVAVAGGSLILYLEAQRTAHLISPHRIATLAWPTVLVVCALSALSLMAPLHPGSAADILPAGDAAPWTERLYLIIFDIHLLAWTVPLSIRNTKLAKAAFRNWTNIIPRGKSTAIGQVGMSIAAASGSAAVAITIVRALTVGNLAQQTQIHLHTTGTILSFMAPVFAAIGIGFPAVANLRYTRGASALLQELDAVIHSPSHANSSEQARSPRGLRLQPFTFVLEYHRTQLADNLRTVAFNEVAADEIVTSNDPEWTAGMALSDPGKWAVVVPGKNTRNLVGIAGPVDRTTFRLLTVPSTSADALAQLLRIARGYRAGRIARKALSYER